MYYISINKNWPRKAWLMTRRFYTQKQFFPRTERECVCMCPSSSILVAVVSMKPTFNTPGCFLIYITTPCNFFTTVRFVKRHFYFSFIQENNKDGNWIKKSFIWSLHLKAWKGLGRINGGLRQGREINEFCMWVFNYSLFFLGCLRKIHFRIYCNEPFIHHFWKLIPVPLRISFVFLTFAKMYRKIFSVDKARQKKIQN